MATRVEIQERIAECKDDLALARQALRDIARGKKQSYAVGTRQAAAYAMSISDLLAWKKRIEEEIAGLEADLAGTARRVCLHFTPRF